VAGRGYLLGTPGVLLLVCCQPAGLCPLLKQRRQGADQALHWRWQCQPAVQQLLMLVQLLQLLHGVSAQLLLLVLLL
jgi:hypothetical protein